MFKRSLEDIFRIRQDIYNKIDELKNEIKPQLDLVAELDLKFQKLELGVEKKFIEAHKEYTTNLFEILGAFLRWNKEISLVSYLGGKEPDLNKLKRELERPLVEEGWAKTHAEEAEKINKALESKGEKVRKAWEQYKEDLLEAERTGKDTQFIKAKLEVLEKLVE